MPKVFGFPNPVNETSARAVATGVVVMAGSAVAFDQPWLLVPLTYGFAARVATGPKLSPLGQLATRVITPRLKVQHRYSPGPPKRMAQGMGLAMSATASLLYFKFGKKRAAYSVLGGLVVAAGLEAGFGLCLGCKVFAWLMRRGLIPGSVCEECADIWGAGALARRTGANAASGPVSADEARAPGAGGASLAGATAGHIAEAPLGTAKDVRP